jgi:hypothetical protein
MDCSYLKLILTLELCTSEERRGIGWWKMGIWRLKDVRGNTVLYAGKRKEVITSCNVKEEGTGGTDGYKKKFTGLHPQIGIKRSPLMKPKICGPKLANT